MSEELEYGHIKKIIQFEDLDKRHADLKIRLFYDGLRQGEFFRALLDGYLERDRNIIEYIENYKAKRSIQSKTKRNKTRVMNHRAEEIKRKYALDEEEIENIFDLIEKEHPEL